MWRDVREWKKIMRKREGEVGGSVHPLPHPLAVFLAHISLRRPHKLNNELTQQDGRGKKTANLV